jgi:hypothetical protein
MPRWLDPGWWLWQPARLWFALGAIKRRRQLKRMSSTELRALWDWWPEYRDRIDATHPVVPYLDAVLSGRSHSLELDSDALLDGLMAAERQAGRDPRARPWLIDYTVEFPAVIDALRSRLDVERVR